MNCITFENDQHTVEPGQKAQKGGAQELWSNPNYFMEVKKGASDCLLYTSPSPRDS